MPNLWSAESPSGDRPFHCKRVLLAMLIHPVYIEDSELASKVDKASPLVLLRSPDAMTSGARVGDEEPALNA